MKGAIESLPATLDLQDRSTGASDGNVLDAAALEVNLHPWNGGKSPRPQGGLNGPRLLHGL
ncbi:hypothetical protein VI817_005203 [Penicillium citrinum]|nr:hypothetical protein VI817_005203 [Penicillium citrinum]